MADISRTYPHNRKDSALGGANATRSDSNAVRRGCDPQRRGCDPQRRGCDPQRRDCDPQRRDGERGVALITTVFIIALATMIVMQVVFSARYDQRSSRAFVDQLQSNYTLRSLLTLGVLLLDIPRVPNPSQAATDPSTLTANVDTLSDIWAQIESVDPIPIEELPGRSRMTIVDESAKIDMNAVATSWTSAATAGSQNIVAPPPGAAETEDFADGDADLLDTNTLDPNENTSVTSGLATAGTNDPSLFWKNTTRNLFAQLQFTSENYSSQRNGGAEFRTIGNTAYGPAEQVAIIDDWIDKDNRSFTSAQFQAQGIESTARQPGWFMNRKLSSIQELLSVPGITLDRFERISRFVRAGRGTSSKININTASFEVLLALGLPQGIATEIVASRLAQPLTRLPQTAPQELASVVQYSSSEFSITVRTLLPSSTRWLRASVTPNRGQSGASGGAASGVPKFGKSKVRAVAFF